MIKRFALLTTIFASVIVLSAQYVLGSGLYDNAAPVFQLGGTWQTEVHALHYQGSALHGSASDNSTLTINFSGHAFTLFISRFPAGGNALVCIDTVCSNLSFFAAVQEYQVAIGYSGLANGQHEIEIIADTGELMFDALLVEPIAQPTTTFTPTETDIPEFTETPTPTATLPPWIEYQVTDEVGNEQTVRYEYRTSAGESLLAQIGFALLVTMIIVVGLLTWGHFKDAN